MSATSPTLLVRRSLVRRSLARLALPCGAALALALAVVLGLRTLDLLSGLSPATQVDGVVVLAITPAGAIIAAWLGIHLLIGSVCALGAACGRRWRAGERLVAEHGPALVRRGVALAVGASIGLGGLSVATAGELPDPTDLGWVPTTNLDVTPVAGPEPGPDGDAGAGDPQQRNTNPELDADSGTTLEREPNAAPDHGDAVDESRDEPDDGSDGGPGDEDDVSDDESTVTEPSTPRSVVVDGGDSLWSITDDLLGGASDTAVARAWPALYDANRDVVGRDPNLIHPGQELVVPAVLEEQP